MSGQFQDYDFTDNPLGPVTNPGISLVSGMRGDILSWDDLAAIPTLGYEADPLVMIEWYDESVPLTRTCVLLNSTAATDTAIGVQRPDDFDSTTNPYVWFLMP